MFLGGGTPGLGDLAPPEPTSYDLPPPPAPTGETEGAELGDITPAAGEPVDFFSTGEGGFLVDSAGNVTFSELPPEPGSGPGSNACGVVLSCTATGGDAPGLGGDGDDDDDD
ncbi:MAG: hypothetical protein IIA44_03915 [Acidobacteria bacterium]|nr:hypothetical protein [Acidobacteriota bacterium]